MPSNENQLNGFFLLDYGSVSKRTLIGIEARKEFVKILNKHRDDMHSFENSKLIVDITDDNKRQSLRPLTRMEAMELEITTDELESVGDITTDSDCEINYDHQAITADLNAWNDNDGNHQSFEPVPSTSTRTTKTKAVKVIKRVPRKNRSGKFQKIKRVFYLAAKIGLSKDDLKDNLDKFPKIPYRTK